MQVVYHLGAHSTDEDRLVKTLMRNASTLAEQGIAVPAPMRYRMVLRDALVSLKGAEAPPEEQERLLGSVTEIASPERVIFSHEFFLCIPQRVVTSNGFYTMAASKLQPLANLFPQARAEFFMGLINPATLIPALIDRIDGASYDSVMGRVEPASLRWAPVIADMIAAAPEGRLVLWCNEDTPLIWPEVLRRIAGIAPEMALEGDYAILATIMSADGLERLKAYLAKHPPSSAGQRRKIVTAFLDKFALTEKLEVELNLPGWTQDLVEEISANYDADIAAIAAMPGVEFIAP
ncbi:hypothetical protein [Phaeovulum sp. W22_SRMD_FR3]|uniref:hypothetical protein n=1 Tax=Phaeovulum sp. W22_SRMD_FR3 TaxID=3240274 RepID=UPI003F9679B1